MGKIVLVTGGARSGKSSFAEEYTKHIGQRLGYIATAQIFDKEMAYRIKLHQERRSSLWTTFEAPFVAHEALQEAGKKCDAVLFDCLTMYTSNFLCALPSLDDTNYIYALAKEKIGLLLDTAKKNPCTTVFVTNEVGSGIVPDNLLSRVYRDIAGLVNQWVAKDATEVYFVVCGVPVEVKSLAFKFK